MGKTDSGRGGKRAAAVTEGKPAFVPRRGRPTPEQAEAITRTIMAAATELFLDNGYEATTMEAIAKTAGIPKSTLYKRYPDKQSVLRAVMLERLAAWSATSFQSTARRADDLEGRLRQRLVTILDWSASDEVRAFTRLAWAGGEGAAIVVEVMQETGYTAMVDILESDIRELGKAEGGPAAKPRSVASTLMALLAGWVGNRPPDATISRKERMAFVDRALELLIHGRSAW